jgi:hypothetical protein
MPKILLYKAGDAESHKQFGREIQQLKPGEYVVKITRNRPIRSLNANKYYHAILNIIGIETGHTHEELHEALKLKFNAKIIHFPKGGSQVVGESTSNLDSKEFAGYVNQVKNWALNEFGIVIPEARDIDYQRWMEIENAYEENQNV